MSGADLTLTIYFKHILSCDLLQCPPVAVAIATEKRCGTSHAKCSRLEFAVVELSDRVGWSSGLVKKELKQLEWSTTELGEWSCSSGALYSQVEQLQKSTTEPGEWSSCNRAQHSRVSGAAPIWHYRAR